MILNRAAARRIPGLPPLPRPPAALLRLIERLPVEPPSFALAVLLNRVLLPRLDPAAYAALVGRVVEISLTDIGLRFRLELLARASGGFAAVADDRAPALRIRASADAFWRLAQGDEDADTLFFERALVMEGDTEYGLLLKNTLDAIGPLLPTLLRRGGA